MVVANAAQEGQEITSFSGARKIDKKSIDKEKIKKSLPLLEHLGKLILSVGGSIFFGVAAGSAHGDDPIHQILKIFAIFGGSRG